MRNIDSKVTIVMYHYVRDLKRSRYSGIKGLELSSFLEQIAYINKHYNVITMEILIAAIEGHSQLPPKSALLTFDDAYLDHYINVYPLLVKYKLQGSFFIPVKPILEHKVLNVNKIHFILASQENIAPILNDIFSQLDLQRKKSCLMQNEYYYKKLAVPNRYDTAEVMFIKRLLQVELDSELRNMITDYLFQKYVSTDETAFNQELYMNTRQILLMRQSGMHIGCHGYGHYWLSSLSSVKQIYEFDKSIEFLLSIGCDLSTLTICYPFGKYNSKTLAIARERDFKLGLTASIDVADIVTDSRYELPRLDTNDLPKLQNAELNQWFYKA